MSFGAVGYFRAWGNNVREFVVTHDVRDECHWLSDDDIVVGDIVYEFFGPTYGCIDKGIAVSKYPGEGPFLEMPKYALCEIGANGQLLIK
jgi:hypothetical protein